MPTLYNTYRVEHTDTFGGEANYCWVTRRKIRIPLSNAEGAEARRRYDAKIKRQAKKALGLSGVPGRWSDVGGGFEFRPYRMCQIVFVDYDDSPDADRD